ncbi:MAG: pitrilysin family protein [Armatimonadota bacterium]|nr:pitrilysin family protein [Armatimonadota bacterium]MDR7519798.1 pitrilysin family protein [Armatimonadota bacterium]MDR7549563.1 pitrilysin family protein [Armatimonadota bacterium]
MTVPIAASQVARTVLPNGLTCLVRPFRETGVATIHGYVKAGGIFDGARPGLARFAGSTLIRGTRRRSARHLAEDLDAMGASLAVSPGTETTVITGRALAEDLPRLLAMAAEILVEPAFPADEVEKVRGELLTALRVNSLDTRQVAERIFRRLTYPEGHPHSRHPDGEEAVLEALQPDDLRAFHAHHFQPGATVIAVVGDVDPGYATDQLARAFGEWVRGPWRMPAFPPPAGSVVRRQEEAVVPGKTQSDLVLGGPGVARTDPDYYGVMMANLLLGQLGMMGRIGRAVREQQGMAYYAYSELRAGLLAGPWWVRAGVNPVNVERAIAQILREVADLQAHGPAPDELADARTFLVGSLAVRLESSAGIAQTLADIELYDLGLDHLERYPSIIAGVSRDDVVAAVRRFPTDGAVLAIAGPQRQP